MVRDGLVFIQRVATNYGVIDLDDGVIDWVTKEELLDFSSKILISGVVSADDIKPVQCTIDSTKCNWSKTHQNIFSTKKQFQVSSGVATLTTEDGKKLKARYKESEDGQVVTLGFFGGSVVVKVPKSSLN